MIGVNHVRRPSSTQECTIFGDPGVSREGQRVMTLASRRDPDGPARRNGNLALLSIRTGIFSNPSRILASSLGPAEFEFKPNSI